MITSKTITSIFMVPTLKIPRNALRENGFINGFSKDSIRLTEYEETIFLLFRPSNKYKFKLFLEAEYKRTSSLRAHYILAQGLIVLAYKLDPKYMDDYKIVRTGKYSKTSKKFQVEFSKTVQIIVNGKIREELSLQYRVFNKTEDLTSFWEKKFDVIFEEDQEIWYGYFEENETLNQEIINKILVEQKEQIFPTRKQLRA